MKEALTTTSMAKLTTLRPSRSRKQTEGPCCHSNQSRSWSRFSSRQSSRLSTIKSLQISVISVIVFLSNSIDTVTCQNYTNVSDLCQNYTNVSDLFQNYTNVSDLCQNYTNVSDLCQNYTNVSDHCQNYTNVSDLCKNYTNVSDLCQNYTNVSDLCKNYTNIRDLCQNYTNVTDPVITALSPPYEELVALTFLCEFNIETISIVEFPLTWSRLGGLPDQYTVVPSLKIKGADNYWKRYQSRLTFTPTSVDNEKTLTCTATSGVYEGIATFQPEIILTPDDPLITGPDTVRANETVTWSCLSTGASRISPVVSFRDGSGQILNDRTTESSNITIDTDNNRIYTITKNLTTSLQTGNAQFRLFCYVVHEANNARYTQNLSSVKVISVLYPPVVTKGNQSSNVITSTSGTRQEIPCVIASSNPLATGLYWTLNDTNMNSSKNFSFRYNGGNLTNPTLIINSVSSADSGFYICHAINDEGTGSFSTPTLLHVIVDGKWVAWGSWDETCLDGRQYRRRECNDPAPSNGGQTCSGDHSQHRNCSHLNCNNSDVCSSHTCNQLEGDYNCTCNKGFYNTDSKTCEDINECQPVSGKRVDKCGIHTCVNLPGNFTCDCINETYVKIENGSICVQRILQPHEEKRPFIFIDHWLVHAFWIMIAVLDIWTICKAIYRFITTEPVRDEGCKRCWRCGDRIAKKSRQRQKSFLSHPIIPKIYLERCSSSSTDESNESIENLTNKETNTRRRSWQQQPTPVTSTFSFLNFVSSRPISPSTSVARQNIRLAESNKETYASPMSGESKISVSPISSL